MNIDNDTQVIAINIGSGQDGNDIAGSIQVSQNPPVEVGAGCTVYGFDKGQLTYLDILVEEVSLVDPSSTSVIRVRSHTDLSILDHVCILAILDHYQQNPPNEIFCKLNKLDRTAVSQLSIVESKQDNEVVDVTPETKQLEGKPNA